MAKKTLLGILLFIVSLWGVIQFAPGLVKPGELSEAHQAVGEACWTCHTPFAGPNPKKCLTCHEPEKIDRNSTGALAFHRRLIMADCLGCHSGHQGRYARATTERFTHDLLEGEVQTGCKNCHAAPEDNLHINIKADCVQCHTNDKWRPATFNHSQIVADITRADCRYCHTPPENDLHRTVEGNCAQCHTTGKWRPADFDHSQYFQLDKDHRAECVTCHPNGTFKSYTCYGCHEHSSGKIEREHREEGIRDFQNCVECHRSGNEHETERSGGSRGRVDSDSRDEEGLDRGREHERSRERRH